MTLRNEPPPGQRPATLDYAGPGAEQPVGWNELQRWLLLVAVVVAIGGMLISFYIIVAAFVANFF